MQKHKPLKPLTLRRNFSWNFAGNLVYGASQWGILVVLAKLGSPEMVGQFTLGIAVTAPVVMFTNLQLRAVQATDAKHQYLFGDYLGLRLISTGFALLAIAAITVVAGYRWETSLAILLVGLAKAFESISDVFYGLFQQYEQMDRVALSLIIRGFLSLILLSIGLYLTGSVLWALVGLVVAWVLVLVSYDIPNGVSMLKVTLPTLQENFPESVGQPHWHLEKLAKLAWLALPLGFGMMLVSLNFSIPRYLIEQHLGEWELGVFAAMAYLMEVGNKVVMALGESAEPRLAKYYAAGNREAFRMLLLKLEGIALVLGGAGILVALIGSRELLTLVYRAEYARYSDLLVWLMSAAALSYIFSFLGHAMTAVRYFRIQMPLFATVTTISAVTCIWLIPTHGLKGVAIALIVAGVIQVTFSLAVVLYALRRFPKLLEGEWQL